MTEKDWDSFKKSLKSGKSFSKISLYPPTKPAWMSQKDWKKKQKDASLEVNIPGDLKLVEHGVITGGYFFRKSAIRKIS